MRQSPSAVDLANTGPSSRAGSLFGRSLAVRDQAIGTLSGHLDNAILSDGDVPTRQVAQSLTEKGGEFGLVHLCEESHLDLAYRWFVDWVSRAPSRIIRRFPKTAAGAFAGELCSVAYSSSRTWCLGMCGGPRRRPGAGESATGVASRARDGRGRDRWRVSCTGSSTG